VHRVTLAGDVPVDVQGEQSRILQGDAAEYSIIADIDRIPGFAANSSVLLRVIRREHLSP
jgi:taurine dioxygenase